MADDSKKVVTLHPASVHVTPKTTVKPYGVHRIYLEFDVRTKAWKWRAVIVKQFELVGTGPTLERAHRTAIKEIDKFLGVSP
jgi:hypothetical protein